MNKCTCVMDNIRFHHSKEIKAIAVAKQITILYSPPYSPKMNTIEMIFGMLKPRYRKACPLVFTKQFDYVGAFNDVVNDGQTYQRFFNHTMKMIVDIKQAIENDANYVFCGYDE